MALKREMVSNLELRLVSRLVWNSEIVQVKDKVENKV